MSVVPRHPPAVRILTSVELGRRARAMEPAIGRFLPVDGISRAAGLKDGRWPLFWVDLRPRLKMRLVRVLGHPLPFESRCRECGGQAEAHQREGAVNHRCLDCGHEWSHRTKAVARADEEAPSP